MESNIANKIKLFENTEAQYTRSFDINPLISTPEKEETAKLISLPTVKPRRKKRKPVQAEQAEYVNVIPVGGVDTPEYVNVIKIDGGEAPWYSAPVSAFSSCNYSGFDSTAYTTLQPFDLAQSEYANLLPLGISDTDRFYADPEGQYVTIKKKQTKKQIKESTVKETQAVQSVPIDRAQFDYVNLHSSSVPDSEHTLIANEEVKYAELDLTQSNYVNVLQKNKLEAALETEYCHLGQNNRLTPNDKLAHDKVLSTENEQEKTAALTLEKAVASGAKNKIRLRKKNRGKDNYPGSLSAKFEELKIQPIQEEVTGDSFHMLSSSYEIKQRKNVMRPSRFNFFGKKPKKLTQEIEKSASNSASMQNK